MNEDLQKTVAALKDRFDADSHEFRGEISLIIDPEKLNAAALAARDEFGCEMLVTETAVDYWPEEQPRFHVVYEFTSVSRNLRLEIRVPVPGINPTLPTVSHIYRNANWRERELWDMFGIKAEGHPDLRRILMPADWEGHPLRKDYPLGYEEPQFTFNFEEINLRKPYAKE